MFNSRFLIFSNYSLYNLFIPQSGCLKGGAFVTWQSLHRPKKQADRALPDEAKIIETFCAVLSLSVCVYILYREPITVVN